MAMYMADLPARPQFPVYGLGPQFGGFRWLIMWNSPQRFYTVALGHGHPEPGPWLAVTTYLKSAEGRIDDERSSGPTGYQDALFEVLINLGEQARATGTSTGQWVTDGLNQTEWGSEDRRNRPADLGLQWSTSEVVIDGQTYDAHTRHVNDRWATLVDLSTVAIAITGPDSMSDVATPLVNLGDTLESYV
jgi:hypothetical protein